VAAIAAIAVAASAVPAEAADLVLPRAPASQTVPPKGFSLSAREAVAVAQRDAKVRSELKAGPLVAQALVLSDRWLVNFKRGGKVEVEVELDGRSGKVQFDARGRELQWPLLAHGQHGPAVRRLHAIMIATGLLFFAVFFDPRRLRRMLHLDLLALLALGTSFGFADAGNPHLATPLMYPPLLYLLGRMIWLGWRGRPQPDDGRLTWAGPRLLLGGLVLLLAARYGWAIADGAVNDIGYASLFGADSIRQGFDLYNSAPGQGDLDAYGPFMYVAYIPFTWLFPFDLAHAHTQGAQAAAMVWDLATIGCLFLLGRRLRPGTSLGLALAFAYAACPWSWLPLASSTNDGLVALLLVATLLLATSPAWRGLTLGLAVSAKFGPAVLGLLFARGLGERGRRPLAIYLAAAILPFVVLVLLFLPDGGVRELWDATIGFQLHRQAPSSLWGLWPALKPLQYVVQAGALALAAASFALPRERTLERVAACGAALLIAAQLSTVYWYYFYVVWFLPYLLAALFSRSYAGSVRNSGSSSASAVAVNSS
jgi:hypothetical protein